MWVLPSNSAQFPQRIGIADIAWNFMLPGAGSGVLSSFRVKGDATAFGTANSFTVPIPVDLFIDGAFAATLATIPAGATTFDITTTPGVVIPTGSSFQYVVDASAPGTTGQLAGVLTASQFTSVV